MTSGYGITAKQFRHVKIVIRQFSLHIMRSSFLYKKAKTKQNKQTYQQEENRVRQSPHPPPRNHPPGCDKPMRACPFIVGGWNSMGQPGWRGAMAGSAARKPLPQ
jgi:hypothetical protein